MCCFNQWYFLVYWVNIYKEPLGSEAGYVLELENKKEEREHVKLKNCSDLNKGQIVFIELLFRGRETLTKDNRQHFFNPMLRCKKNVFFLDLLQKTEAALFLHKKSTSTNFSSAPEFIVIDIAELSWLPHCSRNFIYYMNFMTGNTHYVKTNLFFCQLLNLLTVGQQFAFLAALKVL